MIRILANDGIDAAGKNILEAAGFEVVTDKISQEQLKEKLSGFDAILVRSATQVRKEHIDANPGLKVIGRAGVGMDNIDVAYARENGLQVINTPEASSQSVAELVFSNLFALSRLLPDAARNMPGCDTKEQFNALKKKYSEGTELRGKTIGIVGFGMIGQAVARMAIGLGMRVLPFKRHAADVTVSLDFLHAANTNVNVKLSCSSFEEVLTQSDFITVHIPFPKGSAPLITAAEMAMMKKGVIVVNTARGGVISEPDLVEALNSGHVAGA
ncbi:MAG TPA: NAD(P)-dependent oxidoreductase, partial [Bacteroidia bacterium]|nr:NAD(P)-dependent oxidoreductase [Bacteroidia bacterium]